MDFNFDKEPGKYRRYNQERDHTKKLVSIITPYYNAGTNFEQTFNSVMNQTFIFFEWIIVNDGSTNLEDIDILENLAKTDHRVIIFNQENNGQSSARNLGINKSNTDIIVMLDSDDLIEPYYIEVLYRGLEKHPEAGWCYMDSVGFDQKKYIWCKKFSAGRMTFNNILVYSAAFRKSVLKCVGCYTGLEKHYDEDWELYLKLLSKGIRPVHIPVIGFWYRCRKDGMMNTVRRDKVLKRKSYKHIKRAALSANIKVKEIIYAGNYPEGVIKTQEYSNNKFLVKLMEYPIFLFIIKSIYRILENVR